MEVGDGDPGLVEEAGLFLFLFFLFYLFLIHEGVEGLQVIGFEEVFELGCEGDGLELGIVCASHRRIVAAVPLYSEIAGRRVGRAGRILSANTIPHRPVH